jgi:hypothetical protein
MVYRFCAGLPCKTVRVISQNRIHQGRTLDAFQP